MSKRKWGSSISLILMSAIALITFSGCGKSFDHEAYVKALLDATYKAEFDDYAAVTKSTAEEAEAQYQRNLDIIVDEICKVLSVDVSEQRQEKLKGIMAGVFSSASYEVLGKEKIDGEQYDVQVKILPITNFRDMEEPLSDFANSYIEELYTKDLGSLDPDEVYNAFIDELIVLIENDTKTINYGAERVLTTPVIYNSDLKVWYVPDNDQKEIFDSVLEL